MVGVVRTWFARTNFYHSFVLAVLLSGTFCPPGWTFEPNARWGTTAITGSTGSLGTPVTVTWGIVADGTSISGSEGTTDSNLQSFLTTNIGRDWLSLFEQSFQRLSDVSGLTMVYADYDSGHAIDGSTAPSGQVDFVADMRIGGHYIDGESGSNTLAYCYYPDHGDMVIDTGNTGFYSNSTNNYRNLRNVVMHEAGHGLGLGHVESDDAKFLMEPTINTSYDGPQLDDILGLQRLYGDPLEKSGGNDSRRLATSLGTLVAGQTTSIGQLGDSSVVGGSETDFVSIDDDSDVDFFRFVLDEQLDVVLNLIPRGTSYNASEQGGTQSVLDTKSLSDLTLTLYNAGTTVLATANKYGVGQNESISTTLAAGTYYARVTGAADNVQLYGLDLTATVELSNDLIWSGETNNIWDIGSTSNFTDASEMDRLFQNGNAVLFTNGAANTTRGTTVVEIAAADVMPSSVTFTNVANTYYRITGDYGIVGDTGLTISGGGSVTLANLGNNYTGTTTVGDGSLLQVGDNTTGELDSTMAAIANQGTFRFANPVGQLTLEGVVSGDGLLEVTAGDLVLTATNTYTGQTTVNNGQIIVSNASALGSTVAGTTVGYTGTLAVENVIGTVAEPITLIGGKLQVGGDSAAAVQTTFSGNLSLSGSVDSTLHLLANTDYRSAFGATISGTIAGTNGSGLIVQVDTASTLRVTGNLSHSGGLTKMGVGTLSLAGTNDFTGVTVVNEGTLALTGNATLSQTPQIDVYADATLSISSLYSQLVLADGQTLFTDAGASVVGNLTAGSGAAITGSGTFSNSVVLAEGATLSVGSEGIFDEYASGNFTTAQLVELTISNALTLESGSTLELDLFDSQALDRVVVGSKLTAYGSLVVSLIDEDVMPSVGDAFDILDFGSLTGEFEDIALPQLADGHSWYIGDLLSEGLLQVVISGDFNADGSVDLLDYAVWRNHLGQRDGSGVVDTQDYLLWQTYFGSQADSPASIASTQVPEPTSYLTLLLAVGLGAVCRRGR